MRTGPERDRLADLYEEHFGGLARVAFLLTGSTAAAEDAVHEVFARVIGRTEHIEHPASYLRAAVVNECRTQYRRSQRTISDTTEDDDLPHDLVETRDALECSTHASAPQ